MNRQEGGRKRCSPYSCLWINSLIPETCCNVLGVWCGCALRFSVVQSQKEQEWNRGAGLTVKRSGEAVCLRIWLSPHRPRAIGCPRTHSTDWTWEGLWWGWTRQCRWCTWFRVWRVPGQPASGPPRALHRRDGSTALLQWLWTGARCSDSTHATLGVQ